MTNPIRLRRGLEIDIPILADGEPGWANDAYTLYVGQGGVNRAIGKDADTLDGYHATSFLQSVTPHGLLSSIHSNTLAASPVLGDIMHGNATPAWARLPGNITATRKFLRQVGTGSASAAPEWDTLVAGDLPGHQLDSAAYHTVSGLTPGHFLRALTATTFGFAVHGITYSDVGADQAGAAAARQAAYTNLTSIGSLSNASGWLHNDGAGAFAYSTPTAANVGAEASGAIATHAALITGIHGLVFTAGKTLTLAESLTLNALPIGGLAVATAENTLGSLAVGLTTQYLAGGGLGTVPAWAALNQAAVAGLTTGSSPTFAGLTLSGLTSGRVPYITTGGQLTDASTLTFASSLLTAVSAGGAAGSSITVPYITSQYVLSKGMNLVVNGFGMLYNNYNFSTLAGGYDQVETYAGGGSFKETTHAAQRFNDEFIQVNPTMVYKGTAYFKSTTLSTDNTGYFGVVCYDIDQNIIRPRDVLRWLGSTDTTLAVDLNPGDATITLTDATGWSNSTTSLTRNLVWYPYTNAKGYSYPDYTYSRNNTMSYSDFYASGLWAVGGISGNVITLRAVWPGPALVAGTKVRNNSDGATFKYCFGITAIPASWTLMAGYIGGIDTSGTIKATMFAPGTAFIKLLFLLNYGTGSGNVMQVSAISLSEVTGYNTTRFGPVDTSYDSATFLQMKDGTGNVIFNLDTVGRNIGINVTTLGTGAAKAIGIGFGTAPTTAPADMAQMWVEDILGLAGKAGLVMMGEAGKRMAFGNGKIYQFGLYTDSSNYEGVSLTDDGAGNITLGAETAGMGRDNVDINLIPAGLGKVKIAGKVKASNLRYKLEVDGSVKAGSFDGDIIADRARNGGEIAKRTISAYPPLNPIAGDVWVDIS